MDWLPLLSLGGAALKELGEGWGEVVQGAQAQTHQLFQTCVYTEA